MTSQDTETEDRNLLEETQLLMPWLPQELVQIYADSYVEYGDPELAWAAVRQAPAYDTYYPGNRRDDGTLRLTEQGYASTIDAYEDSFTAIGVNPRVFAERFVELIEGDVSPDELYRDRLQPVFDRVVSAGPQIQAYYSESLGLDMTIEAIVASVLDPDVGQRILNREITMAEIGGEAADRNFDIARDMASELFEQGLGRDDADRFFGEAANLLPTLSVLANRHADPDDEFDLNNFVAAELYDDPEQRRRIRRLVSQERSLFANIGAQTQYSRGRVGGITGLTEK